MESVKRVTLGANLSILRKHASFAPIAIEAETPRLKIQIEEGQGRTAANLAWSSGEFLYICCVTRTDFEISNRYLSAIDGVDHWHEQDPIVVIDIVDALGVELGRTVVCPCPSNQRTVVRPKPAAKVIAHIRAVRGKEPQVRQPRQITQRN
jgi:hypothetical protein